MSMQEFVIQAQGPAWQIWLGDALLGAEPTQTSAVSVARALAQMAVRRGVESKIVVGALDGRLVEHAVIRPSSTGAAPQKSVRCATLGQRRGAMRNP